MEDTTPTAAALKPKLRWYPLTPGRLLVILLATEGILLLSERWIPKGWAVLGTIAAVGLFLLIMLLWFIISLILRWHFQFSIRWLLVLAIAVAVPFSWLAVQMRLASKQAKAVDSFVKLGGSVGYDYEFPPGSLPLSLPAPAWLLNAFGIDFFSHMEYLVVTGPRVRDVDLEDLEGLKAVKAMALCNIQITDDGLQKLKHLRRLESLEIRDVKITDAALEHLRELRQLKYLYLTNTNITDAGTEKLREALLSIRIEHRP